MARSYLSRPDHYGGFHRLDEAEELVVGAPRVILEGPGGRSWRTWTRRGCRPSSSWHNPHFGLRMRMGTASAGGQVAALAPTLTRTPTPSALSPYVWSDRFGHRLQIFGRVEPDDGVDVVFTEGGCFVAVAGAGAG